MSHKNGSNGNGKGSVGVARGYFTFIKELPKCFKEIGGVIPSSPHLAKSMIKPIYSRTTPQRILEVGPGTGPFTRAILKEMGLQDTLTVCEINPRFVAELKANLSSNPDFIRHRDRVTFFEGPIQQLAAENPGLKFDLIVSSLPFNCFDDVLVTEILQAYQSMLADNGTLTFCEYVGVRVFSRVFGSAERRQRAQGVQRAVHYWLAEASKAARVRRRISLLNLPPARTFEVCAHPAKQRFDEARNGFQAHAVGALREARESN